MSSCRMNISSDSVISCSEGSSRKIENDSPILGSAKVCFCFGGASSGLSNAQLSLVARGFDLSFVGAETGEGAVAGVSRLVFLGIGISFMSYDRIASRNGGFISELRDIFFSVFGMNGSLISGVGSCGIRKPNALWYFQLKNGNESKAVIGSTKIMKCRPAYTIIAIVIITTTQ